MTKLLWLAAMVLAFSASRAHAQSEGDAEYCTNVSTDGGHVTLTNNCGFSIHYYVIPYNAPTRHFNNYLDPGQSTNFDDVNLTGRFKSYSCDARYYVVGPDGRVIDHLVEDYSCKRK